MFKLPEESDDHPGAIFTRLVQSCEEFALVKEFEPTVEFLFRLDHKVKQGRSVLGTCYIPSVQGELKPLFEWFMEREFELIPDFLIVLDYEYWANGTPEMREILVFHEASHIGQKTDQYGVPMFDKDSGMPKWTLVGHDVEEFTQVVKRYGAYNNDIASFIAAVG